MRKGAKRITRAQILGETAVQFIGRRFLEMGMPWHPTNAPLEAGIDGFVEVRDLQSGEATNAWIAVQSKGRTRSGFALLKTNFGVLLAANAAGRRPRLG